MKEYCVTVNLSEEQIRQSREQALLKLEAFSSQAHRELPHNKATKHTKVLEKQQTEQAMARIHAGGGHLRLDQYICSLALEGLESRSQLKHLKVEVLKEGNRLKLSHLVENGEQLRIRWQESKYFDASIAVPMDLQILYEDEDIVLLDKPPGLAVHGAANLREPSLVQGLCAWYQGFAQSFESEESIEPEDPGHDLRSSPREFRPGIVHRLDKDTSGVVVVARHMASLRHLSKQFATQQVQKTYYAITHGRPAWAAGRIELPLMRDPKAPQRYTVYQPARPMGHLGSQVLRQEEQFYVVSDKQRSENLNGMALKKGGKVRYALTEYQVLRSWQSCRALQARQILSLLRLQPQTGRTHQLRVHCHSLGCPIVGDPIYGKRQLDCELKEKLPDLALMLHAFRLDFCHPNNGRAMRGQVATPPHFRNLLKYLLRY